MLFVMFFSIQDFFQQHSVLLSNWLVFMNGSFGQNLLTPIWQKCYFGFGYYCRFGLGGGNDPKFEQLNNRFFRTIEIDLEAENYQICLQYVFKHCFENLFYFVIFHEKHLQ